MCDASLGNVHYSSLCVRLTVDAMTLDDFTRLSECYAIEWILFPRLGFISTLTESFHILSLPLRQEKVPLDGSMTGIWQFSGGSSFLKN